MVTDTSLCGLGQTAPNPLSSTLRYFRDEYLAHIDDRTLPGRACARWRLGGAVTVHTLRIDGVDVAGTAGQTILDVARENGIDDPDAVPPRRTVRRGRVPAVLRRGRGREATACGLRDGGQRGHGGPTSTERLHEYRRTIIEMLFVERNHVCAVCVANNHCELQIARPGARA